MSLSSPPDRPLPTRLWVTAIIVGLLGIYFVIGGIWLAALADSWYYLLAGIGMTASAVLMARRDRLGTWIYGLVWIGTVMWALVENGFHFWILEPKILTPSLLGIWIFLPWITDPLEGTTPRPGPIAPIAIAAIAIIIGVIAWVQPAGMRTGGSVVAFVHP